MPITISSSFKKLTSLTTINFGLSMEGIPSRGGPPEKISAISILALDKSKPFVLCAKILMARL
jgi:hypothetical protein